MAKTHVQDWQRMIGVEADGAFGQATLDRSKAIYGLTPITRPAPTPAPPPMAVGGWDSRSSGNLLGVHPDMIRLMNRAREIAPFKFIIVDGLRAIEEQREYVRIGASKTMNSRHLPGRDGLSHAVDILPYVDVDRDGKVESVEMYAWPLYYDLAAAVKQAAKDVGVSVEWGGDWTSFKDGPHWQLPASKYP